MLGLLIEATLLVRPSFQPAVNDAEGCSHWLFDTPNQVALGVDWDFGDPANPDPPGATSHLYSDAGHLHRDRRRHQCVWLRGQRFCPPSSSTRRRPPSSTQKRPVRARTPSTPTGPTTHGWRLLLEPAGRPRNGVPLERKPRHDPRAQSGQSPADPHRHDVIKAASRKPALGSSCRTRSPPGSPCRRTAVPRWRSPWTRWTSPGALATWTIDTPFGTDTTQGTVPSAPDWLTDPTAGPTGYSVTLDVVDPLTGCTAQHTDSVTVFPQPVGTMSVTGLSGCEVIATFAYSGPADSLIWNFGDPFEPGRKPPRPPAFPTPIPTRSEPDTPPLPP